MTYGNIGALVSLTSNICTLGAQVGNKQIAARKSPKPIVIIELAMNQ